jgi:hypothetical protein
MTYGCVVPVDFCGLPAIFQASRLSELRVMMRKMDFALLVSVKSLVFLIPAV